MGLEQLIPSNDTLEIFVSNLLISIFPHAYLRYEPRRLFANSRITKPDFVFAWPEEEREVFMEVTKSPLLPGVDRKRRQKSILQAYVAQYPEYAALVMYLQNFANVSTIRSSLMVLENLSRQGTDSFSAQEEINLIALNSGLPTMLRANTINWELLYNSAVSQISQRT